MNTILLTILVLMQLMTIISLYDIKKTVKAKIPILDMMESYIELVKTEVKRLKEDVKNIKNSQS